jgi:hypothetical protein
MWAETALAIAAGPYFSWQPRRTSLTGYVRDAVEGYAATVGEAEELGAAEVTLEAKVPSGRRRGFRPAEREHYAEVGKALGIPESVLKSL